MAHPIPRSSTRRPRPVAAPAAALVTLVTVFLLLSGCASGVMDGDDPEGRWGSPDPGLPEITLEEDGRAHGTDGCNRFTGTWRIDDDSEAEGTTVVFVDFASTLMACDDIDTWFAASVGARVHDDMMHCLDADGVEIGTLPRQ